MKLIEDIPKSSPERAKKDKIHGIKKFRVTKSKSSHAHEKTIADDQVLENKGQI